MNCPKCDEEMKEEERFIDIGDKENVKQIEEVIYVCSKCDFEINKGEIEEEF